MFYSFYYFLKHKSQECCLFDGGNQIGYTFASGKSLRNACCEAGIISFSLARMLYFFSVPFGVAHCCGVGTPWYGQNGDKPENNPEQRPR